MFAFGYSLVAIFFFFRLNSFSNLIYRVSLCFIISAFVFVVLFSLNLVSHKKAIKTRTKRLYALAYGTINAVLLLVPDWIRFNASTNWIPIYSWEYFAWASSMFTMFIVVPELYVIRKVLLQIVEKKLKNKLRLLFFGIAWLLLNCYGTMFYNAWVDNIVYRAVWSVPVFFIVIPTFLLYYGIKEL